ncbi:exostosin-like glycosyltransferase [Micractinium conductrix]|uniref:Exostosin-like glycosyltransferase n=1 Tax=Micractinium conductrix TaxID=554055 RepID=A0A2P6UZK8_9CHLO|nr:exostosin-like glycosyltransferase [Micractinium conductrix]|eukprot:PSC67271.1 exostosin-like glycosyltransferase [Micractinium conductrix]
MIHSSVPKKAGWKARMKTSCVHPSSAWQYTVKAGSMLSGCVPVIIQEHVFQPYEDVLPYEQFSIRLNNADLPQIREILEGVTDEQYRWLLQGVVQFAPAFTWEPSVGGRAFNYTIASLRRKYLNFKAEYYPTH